MYIVKAIDGSFGNGRHFNWFPSDMKGQEPIFTP